MHMPPPDSPDRPRPESLRALFIAFTLLALQGFGGVLAIVQREVVERRGWLSREEFIEEWAVAQVMPGPNVVNLSLMLGGRWFGWRGALTALAGMLAVPLMVVLVLALFYSRFQDVPAVAGALRGMGAVAAGLIVATGLKLMPALRNHPLGTPMCIALGAACFACVAIFRIPLLAVLAVLGALACGLTWRKLSD